VQALRESELRLPVTMLVAIGVAATLVVVVISFLIITYVKFKKFSATSRNNGNSKATVAWSTAVYTVRVQYVYVTKKRRIKVNESERMKNRQWEGRRLFGDTGCRNAK
jgi:hypothetical protein